VDGDDAPILRPLLQLDTASPRPAESLGQDNPLRDRADLFAAAWELVATANLFIQQAAPWSLAKQGKETELDACLASLARPLSSVICISP